VQPVEILPVQETIVLRARGSELLILPHHVKELKDRTKPRDFSQYFRGEALVNRPARKLFEAWLRKDQTLWPRLYQTVHKEMTLTEGDEGDAAPAPKAEKPAKAKAEPKEEKKAKAEPKEEKPKAKAKAEDKPAKAEKSAKADKPAAKAKTKDAKADKPKADGAKAKAKPAKKK
jgi:hypothetical protein